MKAVFSSIDISQKNHPIALEFYHQIDDLLEHPMVKQLNDYTQHLQTSRLQHSLNVAYYTFLIARKNQYQVRDAVRGALLHDLFLYEWRTEQPVTGSHIDVHPQQALENALQITKVTPVMQDAILSHMWPLGKHSPQTKEGWLIQGIDKMCAALEFGVQFKSQILRYNLSPLMISFLLLIR